MLFNPSIHEKKQLRFRCAEHPSIHVDVEDVEADVFDGTSSCRGGAKRSTVTGRPGDPRNYYAKKVALWNFIGIYHRKTIGKVGKPSENHRSFIGF